MKSNLKKNSWRLKFGQSLIEVIVALGILTVLAVSLLATSLITQKSARSARNNTQAAKLVQQNIEQLRIFRDRKGFNALTNGTCYTLNTSGADPMNWSLMTSNCPNGETITLNNTSFSRKFSISTSATSEKLVVVTVSWTDSNGPQSVTNQTFFTFWCSGSIVAGSPCPSP